MRVCGEPVEQLNELQLIVEIVLEPQYDLVVPCGIAEGRVALGELLLYFAQRAPAGGGDELRAPAGERVERQPGVHRPLVQHVAPGQEFALYRTCQNRDCGIAVRDVQHRSS